MRNSTWRILIVDDDENDRFFLRSSLRKVKPDIHICEARDGEEAIRYLNGKEQFADRRLFPFPNLIFVDLKMPGLDGLGVLSYLMKHQHWSVIPRIVLSSSFDPDDIRNAFVRGARAFHVKAFDCSERDIFCRRFVDYWSTCEAPPCDSFGVPIITSSRGKLGERTDLN